MSTAKPSNIQGVAWDFEGSFAENVNTVQYGLSLIAPFDPSGLTWPTEENATVSAFKHGRCPSIRQAKGGQIQLEMYLGGLGDTATGALPAITDQQRFLQGVIGGLTQNLAATTADGTGTPDVPGIVAATPFFNGSLIKVGAPGDGAAGGAFVASSNEGGGIIQLETGLAGVPTTGDVFHSGRTFYPISDSCNDPVQSFRLWLGTSNGQWRCHGCVPTSYSFNNLSTGQIPTLTVTLSVAYWEPMDEPFPFTGITASTCPTPCTVAGSNLFIEEYGTVTRTNNFDMREFSFTVGDQVQPLNGTNSSFEFQVQTGAYRTGGNIEVNMTFDARTSNDTTFYDIFDNDNKPYHALYTLSPVDGCALAFYFPLIRLQSAPTQADLSGLNSVPTSWLASTDETEGDDISQSAWRLGIA